MGQIYSPAVSAIAWLPAMAEATLRTSGILLVSAAIAPITAAADSGSWSPGMSGRVRSPGPNRLVTDAPVLDAAPNSKNRGHFDRCGP